MPKKKKGKGKKKKAKKIDPAVLKKQLKEFISLYNTNCLKYDTKPVTSLVKKVQALSKSEDATSTKFEVIVNNECNINGLRSLVDTLDAYKDYENMALWRAPIGDDGATILGAFIKPNCFLKKLELLDNRIGVKGCNAISEALHHNECLTHLTLDYNDIGDEGASVLSVGVSWNNALQYLSLNYCSINGEGGEVVGNEIVGKSRSLQELHLKGNPIGAKGVISIGNALKQTSVLKLLNIADTNFGHSIKAIQALGEGMAANSSVTNLNIHMNTLNPEAVPNFLELLKQNKTLTKIQVYEININKETFKSFKEAIKGNGKKKKKKKGKKGKKKKKKK